MSDIKAVGMGRLCSPKCKLARMACAVLWRLLGIEAVSSNRKDRNRV